MLVLVISITIVVTFMVGFIIVGITKSSNVKATITALAITASLALFLFGTKHSYKQGQIDAMNEKYQYERKIKYGHVDTGFVPVDTVYTQK